MYSIREVSKLTGITAYTLRYYEKIGILPSPARHDGKPNGIRRYSDQDLRYIRFIHGLKQTGMNLEDIASFTEEGCLLKQEGEAIEDLQGTLQKRIAILDQHIEWLNQQMKQLESVKSIAEDKRSFYAKMLK